MFLQLKSLVTQIFLFLLRVHDGRHVHVLWRSHHVYLCLCGCLSASFIHMFLDIRALSVAWGFLVTSRQEIILGRESCHAC